jgi:Helix-turn-helix domain
MNDKTTSGNPPPNNKFTPYEWQRAISASNLDPVTRGVLWALSLYINKSTGCAFPSLRTLSSASGYSLDAVRRHIKIALNSGWIEINNAALEGQGWRRNAYIPMIPEGAPRRLETKRKHERVLPVSIPSQEGVLSISTPLTQEGVLPQPQGVLPQPQGVLPQPLNIAPENAPEAAPAVAYSDSPAAPNNVLTRKEQERERERGNPPLNPP